MDRYEYMRLKKDIIPQEILDQDDLPDIVSEDGWIYIEITKGMYGIPQASILANKKMTSHLASYGYVPTKRTPGLWTHVTKEIKFTLCVDDFLIKQVDKHDAQHLLDALKNMYTISTDWDAGAYCGVTFEWDYMKRT